jgi:hypothetical protein
MPNMPTPRAPQSLLCVALLMMLTLSGCMGAGLKADTGHVPQLQGVWRLNRTASEDPQKIIDKLKAEAEKKLRRAMNAPPSFSESGPGAGGRGRGGRGGAGGQQQQSPDDIQAEPPPGPVGPGGDPLRNSPTMHELRAILQRSDYLTIKQSPEQVSFDYGTTVRSYTPGDKSVVSSENGVADQTSGWNDKKYEIRIKPQLGPRVVEEYSLSPDGKQLIVKATIGPFELSKVELTRVYDVTGQAVPNSAPSND